MKSPYFSPATRSEPQWVAQMRLPDQNSQRVHHPAENRNAVLYVTSNCRLCLLYQTEIGAWQSTSIDLESWDSTEDLLSHAAIGNDGDHLVLATHDVSRRLRLYRVRVNWNPTQHSRGNMQYITVAPALEVDHLTALEYVTPQLSDNASFSHLCIVSKPPPFAEQGAPTATTVLAVFTHAPAPLEVQHSYDAFSVLARWELQTTVPTLHDSFTRLKSNGPTPVYNPVTVLRRQADIMVNKLVLTVDLQYHNTMLALGMSDGTIEFRARTTWEILQGFGDTTTASGLPQSGLGYFPGAPVSSLAISADGSALAFVKADGSIATKFMTLLQGWQSMENGIGNGDKSAIETAVVCLARQYTILCSSAASSDETLAILPSDLSQDMRVLFVEHAIRFMCKFTDVSMVDSQKQQRLVLAEPLLTRAMSAQLVLGTKPGTHERTFAGQFAYCFLNLKLLTLAMASALTREASTASRSDLVPSLVGHIKWGMDFILYIIESIADMKRSIKSSIPMKEACEHFVASDGNPALHLLLCSFPRTLLRMQIFSLPQYIKLVQACIPRARTQEEKQKLSEVYERAKRIPVGFGIFPEFIAQLDNAVRTAYTEAGTSGARRQEIELEMMTEGTLPDELMPAVQTLLDTTLPKALEGADTGELHFLKSAWLGIERAVPAGSRERYDAIRKTQLTPGMKLRICRRCGAEMEDIPQEQLRQLPGWLQHGQRQCYCQNYWWLE